MFRQFSEVNQAMLSKLALRNMRRSIRDYSIYFLTLVFGIAIFYMFNTLGSQSVLENFYKLSSETAASATTGTTTKSIFAALESMLGYVSIFVAAILGFLVVYANTFMIRRRKKEFGIYLTLGMSRMTITGILLLETLIVGLFSLAAGIIIGVLFSQLMSVFVVQLFGMESASATFVFSFDAMVKTCIYFGIVFVFTLLVNLVTVSEKRLVRLLNASKRARTDDVRHPTLSFIGFIIGLVVVIGGYIYTGLNHNTLMSSPEALLGHIAVILPLIVIGSLLIIVSISGFLVSLLNLSKKFRMTGLNVFVIKQLGSKFHSTVLSMTVTTLILTITLSTISGAFSITNAWRTQIKQNYPVDMFITRNYTIEADKIENSGKNVGSIYEEMKAVGFDMSLLSEYSEFSVHFSPDVPFKLLFDESDFNELKNNKQLELTDMGYSDEYNNYESYFSSPLEYIIFQSEYNKLKDLYHLPELSLKKNEYAYMSNMEGYKNIMNRKLSQGYKFDLFGTTYKPAMNSVIVSPMNPSFAAMNKGVLVLPDGAKIYSTEEVKKTPLMHTEILVANYDLSKKSKDQIDIMFNGGISLDITQSLLEVHVTDNPEYMNLWVKLGERAVIEENTDSEVNENSDAEDEEMFDEEFGPRSIYVYQPYSRYIDAELELDTDSCVLFIALYIGLVFLMACTAVLGLKQLSDSADNKERYIILRRIGCSEKMINNAFLRQLLFFFLAPLVLALIHSGSILFITTITMNTFLRTDLLVSSILFTMGILCAIYISFMIVTWLGCKRMIHDVSKPEKTE